VKASADIPTPVRVVIVDDHALIRDAVRLSLSDEERIEIVGEARNGAEALSAVKSTDPDVIVLDYRLPDFDAPTLITTLRERGCRAEIVVLTSYGETRNVRSAVGAGARGFLTKRATGIARLAQAVLGAAEGIETLSEDALAALVSSVQHDCHGINGDPTPRECEVWRLLAQGKSNAQIAAELFLAERTVKYHVGHLLEKTGGHSRAELVAFAYRDGLMDAS
jgi:DNA-binding NarL/FixJ family response regulator